MLDVKLKDEKKKFRVQILNEGMKSNSSIAEVQSLQIQFDRKRDELRVTKIALDTAEK